MLVVACMWYVSISLFATLLQSHTHLTFPSGWCPNAAGKKEAGWTVEGHQTYTSDQLYSDPQRGPGQSIHNKT